MGSQLLTEQLVADGWTVMVHLLPGHGWMPKSSQRKEDYMEFSVELVKIAEEYKEENPNKEMVLGGCSHSGAIAGYMAMNGERGTWDRILLMNPFFAPPSGLGADWGLSLLRDPLPALLPAFETVLGSDVVSFGADCNHQRWPIDHRDGGTGGFCQFTLKNFRGLLEFSNEVEGEARARAAKDSVFTGGLIDRWGWLRFVDDQRTLEIHQWELEASTYKPEGAVADHLEGQLGLDRPYTFCGGSNRQERQKWQLRLLRHACGNGSYLACSN